MLYQIIAIFIWASSFVAGKYAFTMLDPVLTVQTRLIIISFLIFPLFLRHWKKVDKTVRPQLWWLGFLNYPAIFLLQFIGLHYTSAASAATIIGLEPLLIVFMGHFFFKDKAAWYHWFFGAMAFAGVAILIAGGRSEGEITLFGCTLILLAGVTFRQLFALEKIDDRANYCHRLHRHFSGVRHYHLLTFYANFHTKLGYSLQLARVARLTLSCDFL